MSSNLKFLYVGYAIVVFLIVLNMHNAFFWDTIQLGSAHATYYTRSNFTDIILPIQFDSGHIPTFGLYIALVWSCFGRSLEVSHLAMLPFAIGIVWQLYKLCSLFIKSEFVGLSALMILIDPTVLSQITLVSPDIPLAFFFLMAVNAVFQNRKTLLMLSILFLFLTSMRGMMVSVCILTLDLYGNFNFKQNFKLVLVSLFKRSLLYLPGFLAFLAYNSYHYYRTGWIGYHKDSPWATAFEPVGVGGIIYNIATLAWRLLDFGKIGIWIVFAILFFKYAKNIIAAKHTRTLLFFSACMIVVFPANMLWAKNLVGHRYLIPVTIVFALLCAHILFSDYVSRRLKYLLSIIWITLLLTGNFWIYPDKIAQGWDATLAHLPYYKLREEAINYIDSNHISYNDVQTFFPNAGSRDLIDLNGDPRNFNNFTGETQYVLYSNVYNVSDHDYDLIMDQFEPVKYFKNMRVYVGLYKRK